MKVGIRARTILYATDTDGGQRAYHPGEVLYVGKQSALRWLAEGRADALPPPPGVDDMGFYSGVVVRTAGVENTQAALAGAYPDLTIIEGEGLNFSKTLLLDGNLSPRPSIVGLGFKLLDTWQVAAPLFSYETLARDVGTEADRQQTAKMIRDLRVPFYDTRLIFMRRCSATLQLLEAWKEERQLDSDDRLAFLRAIYQVKPTLCAGPVGWVETGDV